VEPDRRRGQTHEGDADHLGPFEGVIMIIVVMIIVFVIIVFVTIVLVAGVLLGHD
jgi:hypothetical protein